MNFERGKPILDSIGIGQSTNRSFDTINEAAEWALLFPSVYTEGQITKWSRENFIDGKIAYPPGRLAIIKWIKTNIRLPKIYGPGNETIGLKDSKEIFDALESLIPARFHIAGDVMSNYKIALQELLDHVYFVSTEYPYPIVDNRHMFWNYDVEKKSVFFSEKREDVERLSGALDTYTIFAPDIAGRCIFPGRDLTMIPCVITGIKHLVFFNNDRHIPNEL